MDKKNARKAKGGIKMKDLDKHQPAIAIKEDVPSFSRDPSVPFSMNNTLVKDTQQQEEEDKKWWTNIYDKKTKSCLGRSCTSWLKIIAYAIMYIIFLSTYTMIFLFSSLTIIKATEEYVKVEKSELMTFPEFGIGLTASPTADYPYPLIWYNDAEKTTSQSRLKTVESLLSKRRGKRDVKSDLGPCAAAPYLYCVFIRINKQIGWSGQPLLPGTSAAESAPEEVKQWMRKEKKLWLHCSGFYPWDKEHVRKINYYPNPPGFDPAFYPQNMSSVSPLIAIELMDITQGMSIALECKLWYDRGPSSVQFVVYVTPTYKIRKST